MIEKLLENIVGPNFKAELETALKDIPATIVALDERLTMIEVMVRAMYNRTFPPPSLDESAIDHYNGKTLFELVSENDADKPAENDVVKPAAITGNQDIAALGQINVWMNQMPRSSRYGD